MTPEAQRIAIAEACGWKNVDAGSGRVWGVTTRHKGTPSEFDVCVDVPNYPFDLNAMHDAVMTLTQNQMIDYSRHVGKLVTSHLPASRAAWMDFKLINSTAAQRAEAFLRTIGKWKETK
jgi:hypothetical protein